MPQNRRQRYNTSILARERDRQGLTNTQIAVAVRRSISVVSRTLSGDPQYQGAGTVRAIADFLRIPMETIQPPADEEADAVNPDPDVHRGRDKSAIEAVA